MAVITVFYCLVVLPYESYPLNLIDTSFNFLPGIFFLRIEISKSRGNGLLETRLHNIPTYHFLL